MAISPENCIMPNKLLGICPHIKKVISLLSLIFQESPQLFLRPGLAPYIQYFKGGWGEIPFKFSVTLVFKFGSANHKSFRFLFLMQKLSNGKNLEFHFGFSKIYSKNLCQIPIHASNKKEPPALPGGQDFQLRSGRFRTGLWSRPLSQLLLLEIISLVVRLDQMKTQPTCTACPRNKNLILWAILDRNYSPSFEITLSSKVTMPPADTDRSFRHQEN